MPSLEYLLQVLAGISLLTFIVSIICIPLLVARLPRDYFRPLEKTIGVSLSRMPLRSVLLLVLQNMAGVILLIAGFAMLFLPGQGVITIIIGLCIMRFPYKHQLIYRLTRPHSIQKSLDWIRRKMQKETFYW